MVGVHWSRFHLSVSPVHKSEFEPVDEANALHATIK